VPISSVFITLGTILMLIATVDVVGKMVEPWASESCLGFRVRQIKGMASPQTENGYTRIANEIMEQLCKMNLGPYQSRVLWFLLRKTYGHQLKADHIPLSQFSAGTGIDRRLVHRALKGLSSKKMTVISRDDNNQPTIGFQKDYTKWKFPTRKKASVIGRDDKLSSVEIHPLLNKKEKRKRERVKDKPSPSNGSDPRVKEFVDWWHQEYQKRFSDPYHHNGGKEGSLIKGLLRDYDLPKLQGIAGLFLDSTDPWVQQTGGYTIGVFASQINKLVSTSRVAEKQSQLKEKPPDDLQYSRRQSS